MKKKLLTVLLAVVMVFGVFGLTACGGSNKDEDYNYYGVKYSIEDEVKIEAVTFQAVYKMFTTPGKFVLYVNSGESASDFQAVNKLANDWDVTIYHFNPDLTGGYAKDLSNAVNGNICSDLTGIAAESQLKAVQDLLLSISKKDLAFWKEADGKILGISGADSTVSATGELQYKGSVAAANTIADGAKSIAAVSIKNPSYGSYTDDAKDVPYIPAAYNTDAVGTMNLFADARLHIYDDRDAITEEKTDVFVTVANYEMFAHLLDNNDGYFAVFFGGTWCPNTQAILYHVNYLAKDYGMNKVYFFDPRLDDGVRLDQVVASTEFDQNAYDKDVAAAESVATIAKNAAASTYKVAEKAAEKAFDDAIAAAVKAQDAAYVAAQKEYDAAEKAAQKVVEDAVSAVENAEEALVAAQAAATKALNAYNALTSDATALDAAIKAADAAVKAANKVVTEATAAYEKVVADATKAEQYAKDVKDDAAAAFTAAMGNYTAAKAALETAKTADTSAKAALKGAESALATAQKSYDDKVAANAGETAIEAAKVVLDGALKSFETANKNAIDAAAALVEAEIAVEAAKAARKPAYDAKLQAAADYDALVAANDKEEAAALKVKTDAEAAATKAAADLTAANNNKTAIMTAVNAALDAAGLSNVSKDSPEDWAYVVERLVAKFEVELAAAEKAVADKEAALAKAEATLAEKEAAFAEPKAKYDAAVAAQKAFADIVKGYEDQEKALDAQVAALNAVKTNVYTDATADKETIEGIDAEIKALNDQKAVVTKAKTDLKASKEYTDAQSAVTAAQDSKYTTAKSAYESAKSAVEAAKAAIAPEQAKVTTVNDKIAYANDKAAFQAKKAELKAASDEAAKAEDAAEKALAAAQKAVADPEELEAAYVAAIEAAQAAQVAAIEAADAAYAVAAADAYAAEASALAAADAAYAAALTAAEETVAAARETAGNVTTYSVAENKQNITGNLNTRNNDNTGAAYNYNFTYGSFLANYLPTYWSEWNITAKLTITVGSTTSEFTRMCVPNIMMFNGEKADAKAELIALAEAEYVWADTSVEGNPYRLAWESAVKEVFDANPYATYAPIVVAPEASTDSAAGGAAAPSAPAAGAGDSAC